MNIKEQIKNYLQKIPAFFSGFILGILITGAFFLFKINEYILQFKDNIYPKITIIERKKEETDKEKFKSKTAYEKNIKTTQKNKESFNDTGFVQETEQTDNTPIIEEKIISEKDIKIIHIPSTNDNDSVFAEIADVPTIAKENTIKIIFKKTPFNNKGYLFEQNNLVLYGLQDIPYINLYEYKGNLYIKYDKIIFKIPYSSAFQPLVKLNDEYLIAKMN